MLAASTIAFSQNPNFNASRTFEFDPGETRGVYAKWLKDIGLPDSNGNKNFGLRLEKNVATSVDAGAGVVLNGLNNVFVFGGDTLGYDIRNDSPCTGGAPRFNVIWSLPDGTEGFSFVGGCANDNERFPVAAGWTRVRFELRAGRSISREFAIGAELEQVVLLVDEQGKYTLDNIEFRTQIADSRAARQ